MESTSSGDHAPRLRLVLVACSPGKSGIDQGRVWNWDTGALAPAAPITRRRAYGFAQRCTACGSEGHYVLVVAHEGRELAWCDNQYCSFQVDVVTDYRPDLAFAGLSEIEFAGSVRCACGVDRTIAGPRDNWTLGYCPGCGSAVLARPDPELLVEPTAKRRAS